jgi:hypothetical protein
MRSPIESAIEIARELSDSKTLGFKTCAKTNSFKRSLPFREDKGVCERCSESGMLIEGFRTK